MDAEPARLDGPIARKLAHDLNNLLSIMSGFAEVLADEVTDPRHQADLRELQNAINDAIALCSRVLPTSRVEGR
jgi:signal transduction histidine kinase